MKKLVSYFLFATLVLIGFTSCEDDSDDNSSEVVDDSNLTPTANKIAYVVNYGNYSGVKGEISRLDIDNESVINDFYKNQNGVAIDSKVQYAYTYGDNVFLIGSDADVLMTLDKNFTYKSSLSSDSLGVPRACVGNGDYLYISCWGENYDYTNGVPDSYIVKYKISTGVIEDTVSVPGGPEGIEVANGKIYAALNYQKSVAVIDVNDFKTVSNISTPAVCSYFVKDASDNLYVSLVSTYTDPSDFPGLAYINTSTSSLAATYTLSGVSSNYTSIMGMSINKDKIYMITGAYTADYSSYNGSVSVFDTSTKSFTKDVISGITGINGLSVNPTSDYIYVFTSNGGAIAGQAKVYDPASSYSLVKEFTLGVSPAMAIYPN